MMARTCQTCAYHAVRDVFGRDDHRCRRTQETTTGRRIVNTSCVAETDSIPHAHVKGDKCGPGRVHWVEGAAA